MLSISSIRIPITYNKRQYRLSSMIPFFLFEFLSDCLPNHPLKLTISLYPRCQGGSIWSNLSRCWVCCKILSMIIWRFRQPYVSEQWIQGRLVLQKLNCFDPGLLTLKCLVEWFGRQFDLFLVSEILEMILKEGNEDWRVHPHLVQPIDQILGLEFVLFCHNDYKVKNVFRFLYVMLSEIEGILRKSELLCIIYNHMEY